jgi:hypothetical protein
MSQAKISKAKNHERAPNSAAFVEKMREVFGADQVTVIWVKEGDLELGAETVDAVPITYIVVG